MKSPFKQVGKTVEFGDVRVDYDAANELRQAALEQLPIKQLAIGDTTTSIRGTVLAPGYMSEAAGDYNVTHSQVIGVMEYASNPETWHSKLIFVKSRDSSRDTKIYTTYETEAIGGDLLMARKKVNVIRHLARVVFRDDEPFNEYYDHQYKVYEQPLTLDDIETATASLRRVVNRAKIQRG